MNDSSLKPISQAVRGCAFMYCSHRAFLISFAQRCGCDLHESEDAVQDLFLRLMRTNWFAILADESEAKQGGVLAHFLKRVIINRQRSMRAKRRGGSESLCSLQEMADLGLEPSVHSTPASAYDHSWGMGILERSFLRLGTDEAFFEETILNDRSAAMSGAERVRNHRCRLRLRALITEEVRVSHGTQNVFADLLQALQCAA